MPPGCLAGISWQGTALNRYIWHIDPPSIDEHLHPGFGPPIQRWAAITFITATFAPRVYQRRIDVMSLGARRQADDKGDGNDS
jgi:hypothetical protein